MDATPFRSYVYGDIEGTALTIDVFDNPRVYQARVWENGDTSALEYFETFELCVAFFRTLDSPWDHDLDQPLRAVGIAPQSGDGGETITWTLIDETQVDDWWDGSDYPEGHVRGRRIVLFDNMRERM